MLDTNAFVAYAEDIKWFCKHHDDYPAPIHLVVEKLSTYASINTKTQRGTHSPSSTTHMPSCQQQVIWLSIVRMKAGSAYRTHTQCCKALGKSALQQPILGTAQPKRQTTKPKKLVHISASHYLPLRRSGRHSIFRPPRFSPLGP